MGKDLDSANDAMLARVSGGGLGGEMVGKAALKARASLGKRD